MKLLIITYSYKPDVTPRAFRWSSIVEYWASRGHQVDIVCAWKPGLQKNERSGNVRIYRVGANFINYFSKKFRGNEHKSMDAGQFNNYGKVNLQKKLKTLIKIIYDLTWKKICWPDAVCIWYFSAVTTAKKLLKKEKYHAIISVSHPFTGHLVGLRLKSIYSSLFWLVDVGDPFCFLDETPTNNHKLYQKLNYSAERKILDRADAISVTTGPTLRKYISLFPEIKTKSHVIPPLNFTSEVELSGPEIFPKDQKIRLVYTGTLYKKIRNPEFLLLLFQKLLQTELADNLELHFYGALNDCAVYFEPYQTLLGAKIFLNGTMPRNKIFNVINTADILVNIGNSTFYQLSSKIVEYISTGKPILNIVSIPDDCSMEFCGKYPAIFNYIVDHKGVNSVQFGDLCNFIRHLPPPVDKVTLDSLTKPFQVETIAKEYENLVKYV